MKNYNKFQKLSPEERKFVFELCEQNTYVQAAELIAEPAPIGLSLNTSSSALQRFCARYHPDAAKTETLGQYANLLQVRHQAAEGAFAEGILTLVQNRVLEQLKNGRPLAEMAPDFRILKSAHKSFLEDYAWRKEEGRKVERQYREYLELIAFTHDCDFMRNDIEVDPGAEGVPDDTYCTEDTKEQLAAFFTSVRLRREEKAEQAKFAAEQQRRQSEENARAQTASISAVASAAAPAMDAHSDRPSIPGNPHPIAKVPSPGVSILAMQQSAAKDHPSHLSHSHPTSNQQKPLEIPPIPPNPTSTGIAAIANTNPLHLDHGAHANTSAPSQQKKDREL
jgi:hypothetical protein